MRRKLYDSKRFFSDNMVITDCAVIGYSMECTGMASDSVEELITII